VGGWGVAALLGADQAHDQRHDVGLLRPGTGLLAQLLGDGRQLGAVLALQEGHVEPGTVAHAATAFVVVTCSVISASFRNAICVAPAACPAAQSTRCRLEP